MSEFDRPVARPSVRGPARFADLGRFGDPTTLVCAALTLAMVVLSLRIVSIW